MRKLLLTLFAMALVVAFTAPSYAADFKYSGFFRVRGISGDNGDRNDDTNDSASGFDALSRPRFTATTDGGKIWAVWEIDWYEAGYSGEATTGTAGTAYQVDSDGNLVLDGNGDPTPLGTADQHSHAGANVSVSSKSAEAANANIVFGRTKNRVGVGTNRWVVDFAIPGSALRARWGKTDYTSPDKQIFDSAGGTRWPGFAVYGKLSDNMSLSMFMTRKGASGEGTTIGAADENDDSYYASVGIKVSPTMTLSPWVALSRDGKGKSLTYAAVHAKAKLGIVGLDLTGVTVGGDASADKDASGWALLASGKASLGKLTLIGTAILLSGDDDAADNEEGEFANLMPGGGQFISGVMVTDRSTTGGITSFRARLEGDTLRGTRFQNLNGAFVLGGDAVYAVSKTFKIFGGIHIYQSGEDDAAGNSDFGTELNTGFHWKIYPKLLLKTQFAYLSAGDYGKAADAPDFDDSWTAMFSLVHTF